MCFIPDSRMLGHEVRLRPHHDVILNNTIIIADPSLTALADDVIVAWQLYVKVASSSTQHEVFLQVWRPVDSTPVSGMSEEEKG